MIDDEDEDDDEDKVIAIKTPSRPSSSALNGAANAAIKPSMEIHISGESVQERPVQAPFDETEGESSESGAGTGSGSSWTSALRVIITDPLYKEFNMLAEKKNAWQKV